MLLVTTTYYSHTFRKRGIVIGGCPPRVGESTVVGNYFIFIKTCVPSELIEWLITILVLQALLKENSVYVTTNCTVSFIFKNVHDRPYYLACVNHC